MEKALNVPFSGQNRKISMVLIVASLLVISLIGFSRFAANSHITLSDFSNGVGTNNDDGDNNGGGATDVPQPIGSMSYMIAEELYTHGKPVVLETQTVDFFTPKQGERCGGYMIQASSLPGCVEFQGSRTRFFINTSYGIVQSYEKGFTYPINFFSSKY